MRVIGGFLMARKNWTDKETDLLIELYTQNVSIPTIAKILKRTEKSIISKVTYNQIKRNKVRNFKVGRKFKEFDKTNKGYASNHIVGGISEYAVFIELEQRGYAVFKPIIEGNRSDCIIKNYVTGKTHKIQIKTGTYNEEYDCFYTHLKTCKKYWDSYDSHDVDFFIVRCNRINIYYIIPYADSLKLPTRPALIPHRRKHRQLRKLDAEDYKMRWDLLEA